MRQRVGVGVRRHRATGALVRECLAHPMSCYAHQLGLVRVRHNCDVRRYVVDGEPATSSKSEIRRCTF